MRSVGKISNGSHHSWTACLILGRFKALGCEKTLKRVLFAIPSLAGGGAEKNLVLLLNKLCKQNLDITVWVLWGGGVYEKKLDKRIHLQACYPTGGKKGFLHHCIESLRIRIWKLSSPRLLYHHYIKEEYDIEIAYLEGIATKIIAGGKKGTPKLAWVHSDPQRLDYGSAVYVNSQQEKECYQRFNQVICVSNAVQQSFEQKNEIFASVIHNILDIDEIQQLACKDNLEEYRNWRPEGLRFISVGRLMEAKGYDRLIRIAARLLSEGFQFSLLIVGDGEQREQLDRMVSQLGLSNRVRLTGFMENPYPLVRQADMFICSSLTEGYSLASCEAIILDTPVLATDCLGIRDAVGDSGCGLIIGNSEDELYAAMKLILNHPGQLLTMQQRCVERRQQYASENGMRRVMDVIREVAGAS